MDDLQKLIDGMVGLVDLDNLNSDLTSTTFMLVTIEDSAGNILKEWQLQDTFEAGNWSTTLNYVNETENVNATFVVFHPNLVSELAENMDIVHEFWNNHYDEMLSVFYFANDTVAETTNWVPPMEDWLGGLSIPLIILAILYILTGR